MIHAKYEGSPMYRCGETLLALKLAKRQLANAAANGHLEPIHLKSPPLFTFSTKS